MCVASYDVMRPEMGYGTARKDFSRINIDTTSLYVTIVFVVMN